MNYKIIFTLVALFLVTSLSYASFPVKRVKAAVDTEQVSQTLEADVLTSPAAMAGSKSQGVALLLLVFLGGFAAHRWYLGKNWLMNVLFIVTIGGLGIWAIIDLVRIITGDLTPDNGSYKSDFI
ncbi:MAG: S-adenosyl-L-homocysteine hydrolase [Flavobacteriaceae bacterium]|nr:MAG: S-adenosyl-L-homocysteine hydrolase [Flavobacteriaceae bacterium]